MDRAQVERIQAICKEKNAFSNYNRIYLESVEDGRAVYFMELRPENRNQYGMAHGGALYTLADDAAGTAAYSDGRNYVTQSGELHFLNNRTQGVLRAIGTVRHRGRSTVLVDVSVLDEDEALLATGQFTYFCVDAKRMAERAEEA